MPFCGSHARISIRRINLSQEAACVQPSCWVRPYCSHSLDPAPGAGHLCGRTVHPAGVSPPPSPWGTPGGGRGALVPADVGQPSSGTEDAQGGRRLRGPPRFPTPSHGAVPGEPPAGHGPDKGLFKCHPDPTCSEPDVLHPSSCHDLPLGPRITAVSPLAGPAPAGACCVPWSRLPPALRQS